MRKHLAIFGKTAVEQIFSGVKTVETRFSQKKIPPFGQVSVGDIVYIKPSGREIVGQFLVKKVISLEGIGEEEWGYIKKSYGDKVSLGSGVDDENYFQDRSGAKYGTVIFIGQVEQFITPPVKISKRDQRGWVVL